MKIPKPVKEEQRICFGISWFKTERDAKLYAAQVVKEGRTYNGGWFDGMACGRASSFDYVDAKLGKLFAVTD